MLQMNNRTPFAASLLVLPDENAIDNVYAVVKGTFNIGSKWTLCDEQLDPQVADEYHGEPSFSSIKDASDVHIGKLATDIVMKGNACSLEGYPVKGLDVSLSVGALSKTVRVFGNRVWDGGRHSTPEPFETMPLVYENAYGGAHYEENVLVNSEVRNPVGRGYKGKQSSAILDGTLLPNLEDPNELISHPLDTPTPKCFSYIAPNWQPRADFAGSYDEEWINNRAPFLPANFNRRFLNTVSEDQIYNGYLRGGEPVKIVGMHPRGELNFTIPTINLKGFARINGKRNEMQFNLETFELMPNDLKVSFVWRGSYPVGKFANAVEEVAIGLAR